MEEMEEKEREVREKKRAEKPAKLMKNRMSLSSSLRRNYREDKKKVLVSICDGFFFIIGNFKKWHRKTFRGTI